MKFEDAAVRYPTNGVLELAIKQRKCVELTLSAPDKNTSKGIVHILIVRYFLSVTTSLLFFFFSFVGGVPGIGKVKDELPA